MWCGLSHGLEGQDQPDASLGSTPGSWKGSEVPQKTRERKACLQNDIPGGVAQLAVLSRMTLHLLKACTCIFSLMEEPCGGLQAIQSHT